MHGDFDSETTPPRGEVTREIAKAALGDAGEAKSEASAIARAFYRYKAIAAAVTAALTLAALGYAYRDQEAHYATRNDVETQAAQVQRNTIAVTQVSSAVEGQRDMLKRVAEHQDSQDHRFDVQDAKLDRILMFMKEERGHGR